MGFCEEVTFSSIFVEVVLLTGFVVEEVVVVEVLVMDVVVAGVVVVVDVVVEVVVVDDVVVIGFCVVVVFTAVVVVGCRLFLAGSKSVRLILSNVIVPVDPLSKPSICESKPAGKSLIELIDSI